MSDVDKKSLLRAAILDKGLISSRVSRNAVLAAAIVTVIGTTANVAWHMGWNSGRDEAWVHIDNILASSDMLPVLPTEVPEEFRVSGRTNSDIGYPESFTSHNDPTVPFVPAPTLFDAEAAAAREVALQIAYDALEHEVPDETLEIVTRAAVDADIDPAYLLAVASKESRMDNDAQASKSSANGMFQFTNATWLRAVKQFGGKYGLEEYQEAIFVLDDGRIGVRDWDLREEILAKREDTYLAAAMTAELSKDDQARLEKMVGRNAEAVDMYLLHLLGVRDAAKFIRAEDKNPDQAASKIVRKAAKRNRGLFFEEGKSLTLSQVRDNIGQSLEMRIASFRTILDNSSDEAAEKQDFLRF